MYKREEIAIREPGEKQEGRYAVNEPESKSFHSYHASHPNPER